MIVDPPWLVVMSVVYAVLSTPAGELSDRVGRRLVLAAGLDWREAALLRTLGRYLRQIGVPFGQAYASTSARSATGPVDTEESLPVTSIVVEILPGVLLPIGTSRRS